MKIQHVSADINLSHRKIQVNSDISLSSARFQTLIHLLQTYNITSKYTVSMPVWQFGNTSVGVYFFEKLALKRFHDQWPPVLQEKYLILIFPDKTHPRATWSQKNCPLCGVFVITAIITILILSVP